jgi:hypothetical protein
VCRDDDLPIHIDLAVAHCRRDAKQDTLLMRTSYNEGKYTDFDDGIDVRGLILPTAAAINKQDDHPAVNENRRRNDHARTIARCVATRFPPHRRRIRSRASKFILFSNLSVNEATNKP